MTALEETEYIRTALRDFAKLIAAGINHVYFLNKESAFTFSIESIISFISFSECPWELNKVIFYYLQPENLIYFDQIETKLNSEMEKQKPFIWHLPDRRVSGKTPRADHTWQNPPRLN